MLHEISTLFKHGWAYDFATIQNASEACRKHRFYDKRNQQLLNKWEQTLNKAADNLMLKATNKGISIEQDAKLSMRAQFIEKQREELNLQKQEQEEQIKEQAKLHWPYTRK